ncbi:assembly factor cbp4 [Coemansia javaensis]|uniref:Cytochrome b mRNA-processing protein 4 n=1 Tax=Coemansia javaensis TaxID=2761396 RepID=A0A9W8H3V8_9FUNG|nr:assembly factor cbp4 [Coemansia javaensis]
MSFRRGLVAFVGVVGTGVLLRYTIVPDEQQLLARLSPELRADHERRKAQRREHHDAVMAQILESAKADRPIWDVSAAQSRDRTGTSAGTSAD